MSEPGALPPPPTTSFASDNTAGIAPEVLAALIAADGPAAPAYGADRWSAALTDRFAELAGRRIEVLPCWGGTGANVVGLGAALEHWQAVLCAETAHLVTDEGGAPARMTGALVVTEPSEDGKLTPAAIERRRAWYGDEHHPQIGVVSISQVTEMGTVYSVEELADLADAAHQAGMRLHLDGARLANAVAATGTDLRTMVVETGVDVLTWGATKNGGMVGDVVLVLDDAIAGRARFVRKQLGQLPSKLRYLAAGALALLEDDLWITRAARANAMAGLLAERVEAMEGITLERRPEANSLFVRMAPPHIAALQAWSFFWEWDPSRGLVRFMTHGDTTAEDVERFAAGIRVVLAGGSGP